MGVFVICAVIAVLNYSSLTEFCFLMARIAYVPLLLVCQSRYENIDVIYRFITLCLSSVCECCRLHLQICYKWKEKQYQKLNQMQFRKSYKRNTTCNSLCLSCPLMLQMSSNFLVLLHYNENNIGNVLSYQCIA